MIYTVGRANIYEGYLDSDPAAAKGKAGSVWETLDGVLAYIDGHSELDGFCVYGVDADWELDTVPVLGRVWRSLSRPARLVRIDDEED